jgi:hypothetical protein
VERLDVDVQDDDLRAEIELVADLMIAANQSNGQLSGEDIDVVLGLSAQPDATSNGAVAVRGSKSSGHVPVQRTSSLRSCEADPA